MRSFLRATCFLGMIAALVLAPASVQAQTAEPAAHAEARAFVERILRDRAAFFADTARSGNGDPVDRVADRIAAPLLAALRADRAAAAANSQEIVGLDFDPFTNSQDPCERYRAAGTLSRGTQVHVAIVAECAWAHPLLPEAVYVLERNAGQFVVADIVYPFGQPLSEVLRRLADARR